MFESILYTVSEEDKVAFITLNRPQQHNAIDHKMPLEIRKAVHAANIDPRVRSIVLQGNGKGFCGGYDLAMFAQLAVRGETQGSQDMTKGYDPFTDYILMKECTDCFATLFHSYKPTIAKVHGAAVAGGSDIALSCDFVIMADDARIGYPPSRVWGCPTTAMWAYRVGIEKAKRMLFTGDLIDGAEASAMGLILKAVPASELDDVVQKMCGRIKNVSINQLFIQKQVLNSLVENTLSGSQRLATLFDGMTRNSPDGIAFQNLAQSQGFKAAIQERDTPGNDEVYRRMWRSSL